MESNIKYLLLFIIGIILYLIINNIEPLYLDVMYPYNGSNLSSLLDANSNIYVIDDTPNDICDGSSFDNCKVVLQSTKTDLDREFRSDVENVEILSVSDKFLEILREFFGDEVHSMFIRREYIRTEGDIYMRRVVDKPIKIKLRSPLILDKEGDVYSPPVLEKDDTGLVTMVNDTPPEVILSGSGLGTVPNEYMFEIRVYNRRTLVNYMDFLEVQIIVGFKLALIQFVKGMQQDEEPLGDEVSAVPDEGIPPPTTEADTLSRINFINTIKGFYGSIDTWLEEIKRQVRVIITDDTTRGVQFLDNTFKEIEDYASVKYPNIKCVYTDVESILQIYSLLLYYKHHVPAFKNIPHPILKFICHACVDNTVGAPDLPPGKGITRYAVWDGDGDANSEWAKTSGGFLRVHKVSPIDGCAEAVPKRSDQVYLRESNFEDQQTHSGFTDESNESKWMDPSSKFKWLLQEDVSCVSISYRLSNEDDSPHYSYGHCPEPDSVYPGFSINHKNYKTFDEMKKLIRLMGLTTSSDDGNNEKPIVTRAWFAVSKPTDSADFGVKKPPFSIWSPRGLFDYYKKQLWLMPWWRNQTDVTSFADLPLQLYAASCVGDTTSPNVMVPTSVKLAITGSTRCHLPEAPAGTSPEAPAGASADASADASAEISEKESPDQKIASLKTNDHFIIGKANFYTMFDYYKKSNFFESFREELEKDKSINCVPINNRFRRDLVV